MYVLILLFVDFLSSFIIDNKYLENWHYSIKHAVCVFTIYGQVNRKFASMFCKRNKIDANSINHILAKFLAAFEYLQIICQFR